MDIGELIAALFNVVLVVFIVVTMLSEGFATAFANPASVLRPLRIGTFTAPTPDTLAHDRLLPWEYTPGDLLSGRRAARLDSRKGPLLFPSFEPVHGWGVLDDG